MAGNGVIGRDNGLPWRLPKDMRFFMTTTQGHPVVMGRRTFESMKAPLPGRTNIVVTRNPVYHRQGIRIATDFAEALELAERQAAADGRDELFIIGGVELFRLGLAVATRLYVTEIDAELDGDTFFPPVDWSVWRRVESESHPADESHRYPFRISRFERT